MKYIRESWKGIVFLTLLIVINALMWLFSSPIFEQPIESTAAQIIGSTILLGFTLVFFLSTRNRFITWLFGGLENVYTTHRVTAMVSLLIIFLHAQTASRIFQYYRGELPLDAAAMGPLARNIFIALIVIALLAKYMKYEHWRIIHRLMIVPYLLSAYHAFFLSSYDLFALNPLAMWMHLMVITGTLSSLYMLLLYRQVAFRYDGVIERVEKIGDNVTEIEVRLKKKLGFKTGQFVFVKIDKKPFKGQPHPFSIAGNTGDSVIFTIKGLGDYTSALSEHLETGDTLELSKAYGHMTFDDYEDPQVWIAGGIGITPFLGHLRSHNPPSQNITLYYSVKNMEDAVHLDYIKELDRRLDNFTLKFFESDKYGFLTAQDLDIRDGDHVFMCGPIPMAKALKKELRKKDVSHRLVYEAFSFTGTLVPDLITFFKRFIRKMSSRQA